MTDAFGKFKTTLSEDLPKSACEKLCTVFRLPASKTETVLHSNDAGLTLLNILDNELKIEPTNVSELLDALEHLKLAAAAKRVREYKQSIATPLPDTLDSDEDDQEREDQSPNFTFEELKRKCGITERLTLNKMLEIKDPRLCGSKARQFWEKITSMDFRITSSDLTQDNTLSVRDLTFAILHSSNNLLRQDIVTKMSSCQLAVPLVLNDFMHSKPLFLYWAFRTIRKTFKTPSDHDPLERPIFQKALLTVSVLRIGELRVSKSKLLNSLLGECQGAQPHSYFANSSNDSALPFFYEGAVDVVWYTPHGTDNGSLRQATAFFNLRGDSRNFPHQTNFVCKVSNLIIVLINKANYQTYLEAIKNIETKAKKVLVVAIKETDDAKTKKPISEQNGIIIVRNFQVKPLNECLCREINTAQECISEGNLMPIEAYADHVKDIVHLDISREFLAKIKSMTDKIVCSKSDIGNFKLKALTLLSSWLKWAELETTHASTVDSAEGYGREHQLAFRKEKQMNERKKQNETALSEEVKIFWELFKQADSNNELFDECLNCLQTMLFDLTQHSLQSPTNARDNVGERARNTQVDFRKTYLEEAHSEWEMKIGIEDFVRELGQVFEAHVQCDDGNEPPAHIKRLPFLAAQFLLRGNCLEILDDRSYCIPQTWIASIMDELSKALGKTAKVIVLSIIGVQGSGKSTLLNSMFGTKFHVSAGRCTRGLFMRLLKVEENFASELGCQYFIILDTEGLRADHGGFQLDKASNRRLDNKMSTLAMCLADLNIVNIVGELISSDVTNFLEIAAYAFIRMKEVDLKSHCRFIQQRVSNITAPANNSVRQIEDNLSEAVKNVAKREGQADTYESFSQIFQLKFENHTRFLPNLWSGNMNPPNPLYSQYVHKVKNEIFDSIREKDLQIQFTFETFCSRLMAVDNALKEEQFAINFEDVAQAIAYDDLSVQCNKWIRDVRLKVTDIWTTLQRKIRTMSGNERTKSSRKFKEKVALAVKKERQSIRENLKLYLQENDKERYSFQEYFGNWLDASLSNIEIEINEKITNTLKFLELIPEDIPSFIAALTKQLRLKAVQKATSLRKSEDIQCNTENSKEYFDQFWDDESRDGIIEKCHLQQVNEVNIRRVCTNLLLQLCTNNVIEKDILNLLKSEKNIKKHAEDFDWKMYVSTKNVKERSGNVKRKVGSERKEVADSISKHIKKVKDSELIQFETDCFEKPFDPYLVHNALQKALTNLTVMEMLDDVQLPTSLTAKVLLHICGRVTNIATRHNDLYQKKDPWHKLLYKEKPGMYLDFKSFFEDKYQDDRAYQCVCEILSQQFTGFTVDSLRTWVISYFSENFVKTKKHLYELVLGDLWEAGEPSVYIDFVNNHDTFLIKWMKEIMIKVARTKQNNMSWIQLQYKELLSSIFPLSDSCVQELSQSISMKEWCERFAESISEEGKSFNLEKAWIYEVSNIPEFTTNVIDYFQTTLREEAEKNVIWPSPGSYQQCEAFIEYALVAPYKDVIRNFIGCREKCPFCKAPCCEENDVTDHTHTAFCHYPRGLIGKKWKNNKLVEEFCNTSVASKERHFKMGDETFLFKDYRKYFPTWKIPTHDNVHFQSFWKWVLYTFNEYCSKHYHCDPADIPEPWKSPHVMKRAIVATNRLSVDSLVRLTLYNQAYLLELLRDKKYMKFLKTALTFS